VHQVWVWIAFLIDGFYQDSMGIRNEGTSSRGMEYSIETQKFEYIVLYIIYIVYTIAAKRTIASILIFYYIKALFKRSVFWYFLQESDNINLGEIEIFCYLNCISECINGFSMLKNPWTLEIYRVNHSNLQTQQFLAKF